VVRLVERLPRVRIDEIGKLLLAAAPLELAPEPRPTLRTRVDDRFEVEDRQRLAHLPAVRAAFEFVELERLLRARAERADERPLAGARDRGGERSRDVDRPVHRPGNVTEAKRRFKASRARRGTAAGADRRARAGRASRRRTFVSTTPFRRPAARTRSGT